MSLWSAFRKAGLKCIPVFLIIQIYTHKRVYTHMYTHTDIYIYIYIYTYTHMHIYKRYLPEQNKCANIGKQGKNQQDPEQLRPEK